MHSIIILCELKKTDMDKRTPFFVILEGDVDIHKINLITLSMKNKNTYFQSLLPNFGILILI